MKAVMMLCDHAAVADGKLYINGGGWSLIGPAPAASAIAIKIDVPWDRTNSKIVLVLALRGSDGEPIVQVDDAGNGQPLEIRAEFEVGRPPGIPQGTPIDVPLAFNLPPLPLQPGRRYSWDLTIGDETHEDWHLAFGTRALPPMLGLPPSPG